MWYASAGDYYLAIRLMMYWYMLPYGQTLNILYSVKEVRYEKNTHAICLHLYETPRKSKSIEWKIN